ncbi:hypothetical protein IFM89_039434, partial [Coptis chinensis]
MVPAQSIYFGNNQRSGGSGEIFTRGKTISCKKLHYTDHWMKDEARYVSTYSAQYDCFHFLTLRSNGSFYGGGGGGGVYGSGTNFDGGASAGGHGGSGGEYGAAAGGSNDNFFSGGASGSGY